ncbi:hypothetical protein SAMN02787118_12083 [Streptomyces mirabilis]|uniref:Uncharacterized protein n=1 Tax=Streptomyces mirabilis TaxID=68239 RepID=A0A1I2RMD1_9ACTN|nr:hypothetical protein SAMN02787118_12083 [Streptomyces mirabilis]
MSRAGRRRSSALYDAKQIAAAIIQRSPAARPADGLPPPTRSSTPAQAISIPTTRRAPSRMPPIRSYHAISTGDAAMIMPMLAAEVEMPAWLTRVL